MKTGIKFNKHNVVNQATGEKARVFYNLDNHISGRKVVTLYGKTCLEKLSSVIPQVTTNDSEYQTDYVVSDVARIFEGDQLYTAARARAEANRAA